MLRDFSRNNDNNNNNNNNNNNKNNNNNNGVISSYIFLTKTLFTIISWQYVTHNYFLSLISVFAKLSIYFTVSPDEMIY